MYVYVLYQEGIDEPRVGVQGSRDVYVGVASNIELRLAAHNLGKCKATRGMKWVVQGVFLCYAYNDAFIFERWLKTGQSLKKRLEFVGNFRREGQNSLSNEAMLYKAIRWAEKRALQNPLPVRWK